MQSSRHGSLVAALASAMIAGVTPQASAHRLDEYLQATRIALDPEGAHIELDLTAGTTVANLVLSDIDRDRSGTISTDEAAAYAAAIVNTIALEVDGTPLVVHLLTHRVPGVEAIRKGEAAIRLELAAAIPPLPAGSHHLRYRNDHRADIGAYLANALVPIGDRVSISGQRRDVNQRELIVDYVLDPNRTTASRAWFALCIAVVFVASASLWRRRPTRPT